MILYQLFSLIYTFDYFIVEVPTGLHPARTLPCIRRA